MQNHSFWLNPTQPLVKTKGRSRAASLEQSFTTFAWVICQKHGSTKGIVQFIWWLHLLLSTCNRYRHTETNSKQIRPIKMTSPFTYVYDTSVSPQTAQNEGYIGNGTLECCLVHTKVQVTTISDIFFHRRTIECKTVCSITLSFASAVTEFGKQALHYDKQWPFWTY